MTIQLTAIVAMTPDRVIGRAGTLPWHLPEDLAFFKRTTTGHPIVMGRKTYESIGRPLPKRRNIVLTRDPNWSVEGVEVIHRPKELENLPGIEGRIFIIGGSEIYAAFLPVLDDLLVSHVFESHAGVAGDGAAGIGGVLVFRETLGVALFGDLGGGGFAEHGEDQFQVGHVIAEVFLGVGECLELFILGGSHAEGGFADFRSEDGEFPALFHPALAPLVGEFIADGDAAQAFFDPFLRVAFLLVDRPHALGGEFRVLDFLKAFEADFGEPALEGFRLGGWDGLDEAE
jgi:dihydrofolate reductase